MDGRLNMLPIAAHLSLMVDAMYLNSAEQALEQAPKGRKRSGVSIHASRQRKVDLIQGRETDSIFSMTDRELQLKAVALRCAEILTAKYTKYAKREQEFGFALFAYFAWFAVDLIVFPQSPVVSRSNSPLIYEP
jgi:hypothetical protein